MSDLSDFGGGIDSDAQAADLRDDEQEALGVRCDVEGCETDVERESTSNQSGGA